MRKVAQRFYSIDKIQTHSLLHNEDHTAALYSAGYLVEVDIESRKYESGKRPSPNEKFIAYCYAGNIPGI